jgi:hypothetical protein
VLDVGAQQRRAVLEDVIGVAGGGLGCLVGVVGLGPDDDVAARDLDDARRGLAVVLAGVTNVGR